MKKLFLVLVGLLLIRACAHEQNDATGNLLPVPKSIQQGNGFFTVTKGTGLCISAPENDRNAVTRLLGAWEDMLSLTEKPADADCIAMEICEKVDGISSPEGYAIEVTEDGIKAKATSGAGLFYAAQTLLQLADGGNRIPVCSITDEPQFGYRGMMLDVSRHFFGKEFIKKQIDAIAHFKMNRLHLHLTDAAGWRIEIKKYPRLTDFAAWRKPAIWKDWWFGSREYVEKGSEGAYGGYYTQDDIREIVAYAAERYITIIPEIEMPAHSEEVLTAYPELSCTHEPYKQADFCIGNEKTYEFLENVLTEVMELFPSEYIHIGGDEAGKASWPHCPLCQKRMKEENLSDVNELQSYLIHRIEKFVNSKGRQIIGWDEILDGGLAPNATVMSWRGTEGGIAATESGHKAIMTPGGYCYLDSYQDAPHTQPMAFGPYMPLEKVYSYNPTDGLKEEQAKLIYGVQGNLWVEYIPTEELVEYMIYPRILAIAEIGWSNPAARDYSEFRQRAVKSVEWLKANGYNAFDLAKEFGQRKEALTPSEHLAKGKNVAYSANAPFNDRYNAGGETALVDGIHGGWTYLDEKWQGFIKGGIDITIDLGEEREISSVSADFMQMCIPDVWLPAKVTISLSSDSAEFRDIATIVHNVVRDEGLSFKNYGWNGKEKGRYVRYRAECGPQRGWLFTDEIIVK
ncbi:MAG: beta-N-acetylhexosaminidase [Bacteroidaceae bacterium]|nr:beta-N-acetylhexosaminidase [Bacteroidaceae bacterium]